MKNVCLLAVAVAAIAVSESGTVAGYQRSMNVSHGGADVSRNGAGLQARWADRDGHAGVFLGGDAQFEDLAEGIRPAGTAALVIAIAEDRDDARLLTYAWSQRAEVWLRDGRIETSNAEPLVRSMFRRAAHRFADVLPLGVSAGVQPDRVKRSANPAPRPSSRSTGRYGSALWGLPARSDDTSQEILQAGWLEGRRRYGLFARGAWGDDGVTAPGDWLVTFELDTERGDLRLAQAIRRDDEVELRYFENGQATGGTEDARRLIAHAVRAVR